MAGTTQHHARRTCLRVHHRVNKVPHTYPRSPFAQERGDSLKRTHDDAQTHHLSKMCFIVAKNHLRKWHSIITAMAELAEHDLKFVDNQRWRMYPLEGCSYSTTRLLLGMEQ